jgi:CDP-glucose 4,6-dehydratase
MFDNIYSNKNILITGHTGFKGSWLALWLSQLGAQITGYSLQPPTDPNHFQLHDLHINSVICDIRNADKLKQVFQEQQPEIVFHLAAQAIVRRSYREPVETFTSNVLGTINLLEAARACDSVRAIVIVTSDKCYENKEWFWGYREIDPLGGYDPYSASKGCAEIVTGCWRNSYFNPKDYGKSHQTLLASARAGNVIGGGDWAADRLIPDIMRATAQSQKVTIRNPHATRPWQHVLEPLSGYLLLGQRLLEGRKEFADAWNFGPSEEENLSVDEIVGQVKALWPKMDYHIEGSPDQPHEAGLLRLDCSKARAQLQWAPAWTGSNAVEKTVSWYRNFYETGIILSMDHLHQYVADAQNKHIAWAEK